MIVKTYPHGDFTLLKLHMEIDASGCVTDFDGVEEISCSLRILGNSIADETVLDSLIANHVPEE